MKTGLFRAIVADPAGSVRDPCVHYDGRTILFSYRPAGEEHFHLYTVNADGLELKRLTSGGYDDIEPAWLPDGDIVFVSTRCRRWVNCWVTQVATIYRMKADGSGIRMISANPEHDNTPWVLSGGRQGCVGCHERKTANMVRRAKPVLKALARGPSEIDPEGRLFDVADFPRDMQPVLDRAHSNVLDV